MSSFISRMKAYQDKLAECNQKYSEPSMENDFAEQKNIVEKSGTIEHDQKGLSHIISGNQYGIQWEAVAEVTGSGDEQ